MDYIKIIGPQTFVYLFMLKPDLRPIKNAGQASLQAASDTAVVTKLSPKTARPSLYKVLLLNDDFTPMDFVVTVLERCFGKTRDEAAAIMLCVHNTGVGVCGVYTFEVAESKVVEVMHLARRNQHPLQCIMEKE
jgi:ATP-dependent Clp protease adaptor protein ClpS